MIIDPSDPESKDWRIGIIRTAGSVDKVDDVGDGGGVVTRGPEHPSLVEHLPVPGHSEIIETRIGPLSRLH